MDLTAGQIQQQIALIAMLPLAGAIVNGCFGHRLPRTLVGLIACAAPITAFAYAVRLFLVLHAFDGAEGPTSISTTLFTWMDTGAIRLDVRFVVDHLSAVMLLVICGVGSLIHVYSWGYMAHEPAFSRYFAYLNLFMFAMLILVLGDSLPLMFVGWEGVGLCSYLLIGFWYTDNDKASAGKKAFVVNRIGDFGFLTAMMVLLRYTGNLDFAHLRTAAEAGQVSGYGGYGGLSALDFRSNGKKCPAAPVCVASRRHGWAHAGLRVDSCGNHGHRRCLFDRPHELYVCTES